jgi:hypothetical protein
VEAAGFFFDAALQAFLDRHFFKLREFRMFSGHKILLRQFTVHLLGHSEESEARRSCEE